MNINDAKAALEKAQKDYSEALKAERANAIANAKAIIREFSLTASELGLKGEKSGRSTEVKAKYANPVNPSETWSGRGRKPKWVEVFLANGGNLQSVEI